MPKARSVGLALLGMVAGWLAFGAGAGAAAADGAHVVYYSLSNGAHSDESFPFRVLELALKKCGKDYQLKPSPAGVVTEQRATEIMLSGGKIDVEWVGANAKSGELLSPVMFPIDGGLLGYRLFLIDGARQSEFSAVRSLSDLKRFVALQGKGWSDVEVLRKAGVTVRTAADHIHIYRMTLERRGDYFPRAAFEAFTEQGQYVAATPGLAVEKTLILHYPLTLLYYVRRSDHGLHDDIYRGLMAAVADGSYKKLFLSDPSVRAALEQTQFKTRRILDIDNPVMPADVKAIDPSLWFRP